MMTVFDLTPTERLVIFSLNFEPNQTVRRLQATTGTRTEKHLVQALRTLRLAGAVEAASGEDGIERFSIRRQRSQKTT
jgi:hypothetical protein